MAIYFVQRSDGMVKIGTSIEPRKRIKNLERKHGQLIVLGWGGGHELAEWNLHQAFANIRVDGEFFKPEQELLDFIDKEAIKVPFEDVFDQFYAQVIAKEKAKAEIEKLKQELEETQQALERYREWHNRDIELDLSVKPINMSERKIC